MELLIIIGGSIIIAGTSAAWITTGAVIFATGIVLSVWSIFDYGKMIKNNPGNRPFKGWTDRFYEECDSYP